MLEGDTFQEVRSWVWGENLGEKDTPEVVLHLELPTPPGRWSYGPTAGSLFPVHQTVMVTTLTPGG